MTNIGIIGFGRMGQLVAELFNQTGPSESGEDVLTPARDHSSERAVARHFVTVVRGEKESRVSLQEGRYALKVVLASLESAKMGAVVKL